MPVFEFRCRACQLDFERLLFSRTAAVECPGCGSSEVEKRPSLFGTSGTEKKVSSSSNACASCSSGSCASCGHG